MRSGAFFVRVKKGSILLSGLLLCLFSIVSIQPLSAQAAALNARAARSGDMALVRLVHASPDIGVVDIFVDRTRMLSSFQFASVTDYVPLPSGTHQLQLALIGKGVDASVVTATMQVQAGRAYTIAALGTRASGFSISVFTDNNTIAGNDAKTRIYHLSPGTGAAQVEVGSTALVRGLSYPQASRDVELAAGSYTFHFAVTAAPNTLPLTVTLRPWKVTSIFIIGLLNSKPALQFITATQAGLPSMPSTGSDPYASPAASAPGSPAWSAAMPLLLVGALLGLALLRRRATPRG